MVQPIAGRTASKEINTCGLPCPIPMLRARAVLLTLASGQILKVIANDQGVARDLKDFARLTGNTVQLQKEENGVLEFFVQKR